MRRARLKLSTKNSYFVFVGPRLGALDVVVPIINEVRSRCSEARVIFVFLEDAVYRQLREDRFLSGEVDRLASRIMRIKSERWTAAPLYRFFKIAFEILLTPGSLVLHAREEPRITQVIRMITQLNGGTCFEHPKTFVPMIFRDFESSSSSREVRGDAFLCFSELEFPYYKSQGISRLYAIGYPRLYCSWLSRASSEAKRLIDSEYAVNQVTDVVALFLGSTIKGIYEFSELEAWLTDVALTISEYLPDAIVFVKPHPTEDREELRGAIEKNNLSLKLTELHASVLASRARLVIAHHTSTIIDALGAGKPVIQYQQFTPHWIARHPERSIFPRLGSILAQTREELKVAVERGLAGTVRVPNIRETLGHARDLSAFGLS